MIDGDGRGQEAVVPADGTAALSDISECLRHLANGYGLLPTERSTCIAILEAGIPGVDTAELAGALKVLAASGRLTSRQRDKASELSLRLAEWAETVRSGT